MASSFSIEVKGIEVLRGKITGAKKAMVQEVDRALQSAANDWANAAVRDAPVYDGKLRGSITSKKAGTLHYSVSANVFYAPYVEFGTKKRVDIPAGLQDIAAQYKGAKAGSGDFKALVLAIEKWVKKNRIKTVGDKDAKAVKAGKYSETKRRAKTYSAAAFWIALSIIKNGIKPHPYFFKHKQTAENAITKDIELMYKSFEK